MDIDGIFCLPLGLWLRSCSGTPGLAWSHCSFGDGRLLETYVTLTLGFTKLFLHHSMPWTELASRLYKVDVLLMRPNTAATTLAKTGTAMPAESWTLLITGLVAPGFPV